MPHVIIDHSANLADHIDVADLVHALHGAALGTGLAPPDGLRTRAHPAAHYEIANGDPAHVYVAITARLARGRSPQDRRRFIDALVDAAEANLGPAAEHTALSVEYQEIDPELRINRNHLRDRMGRA